MDDAVVRVTDKSQIVLGKFITFCCEEELAEVTSENIDGYRTMFDEYESDIDRMFPLDIWDTKESALNDILGSRVIIGI